MVLYVLLAFLICLYGVKLLWDQFAAPVREVSGGISQDVLLPHTSPIELYYADVSSNSMKVRMCLAAAGLRFKGHLKQLPSSGSYEMKAPDFLHINPAGTVPVLIHHGHPVYESSEQIEYIAGHLIPEDRTPLYPVDPNEKLICKHWVYKTSIQAPEILENMSSAFQRRAGNCIFGLTVPLFVGAGEEFSWKTLCAGILIGGLRRKTLFTAVVSLLGINALRIPMVANIMRLAKKALLLHFDELELSLKERNSAFIHGDDLTLADIGWCPIFERMDVASWWDHIDPKKYFYVTQYWHRLRELPSYKEAIKCSTDQNENKLEKMKLKIRRCKSEVKWFNDLFAF